MVAFNEAKKSKIEKILKEDNMEMGPGGPKKIIRPSQRPMKPEKEKAQSKSKIGKGRKIIKEQMAPEKTQPLAKGGRAGFKSGMRVCKLAMKGKGRAYGKNS